MSLYDEFDIQNLVDNKSEGVYSGGVHLFTKCFLCNSAGFCVLDMDLFQIHIGRWGVRITNAIQIYCRLGHWSSFSLFLLNYPTFTLCTMSYFLQNYQCWYLNWSSCKKGLQNVLYRHKPDVTQNFWCKRAIEFNLTPCRSIRPE